MPDLIRYLRLRSCVGWVEHNETQHIKPNADDPIPTKRLALLGFVVLNPTYVVFSDVPAAKPLPPKATKKAAPRS